jgi:hypothetical protein
MGRKSRGWDGKICEHPTPGAGWELDTVDWELRQHQIQAQNRCEDRAYKSDQRRVSDATGVSVSGLLGISLVAPCRCLRQTRFISVRFARRIV